MPQVRVSAVMIDSVEFDLSTLGRCCVYLCSDFYSSPSCHQISSSSLPSEMEAQQRPEDHIVNCLEGAPSHHQHLHCSPPHEQQSEHSNYEAVIPACNAHVNAQLE
ncbi:hypothetical protein H0G86_000657 [Trichoderma simmonsii]|uniref:Uncharacterized protein n=1 Tax=Trichoderma simmonsii TaxID=1491479 RepID=A0A8G0PE60_9HYPO|nr:hypothetical protein H0G86_000657 [Trichoderma simmonsii]